jgi:hypothetical protein
MSAMPDLHDMVCPICKRVGCWIAEDEWPGCYTCKCGHEVVIEESIVVLSEYMRQPRQEGKP